ncbi:FAD-dependent oxidoreductase [Haloprofundus sp. MHR1]|uniref:FAD-dependent oxidoreductase n=1 Tax=Haloprofundus sp. MHR1 TaxID=2572921 RepID=UPI0010BE3E0A|nr:FAD-dependent oxidoreductase [Haloprofundus sp. MHR1]QCJ48283.1 FAD-dependent oxidoreductase [Haloprofundus sp. MHR1]
MTIQTEVLVIGGGATGVGIARDLAMRGVDVVVAERGGLASGTSGRSHGLLHSGARYAPDDELGAEECIRENRILRDIAGHCIRDTGGFFVQLPEDDPEFFEEKLAACEDIGIEAEVLGDEETRAEVPGLTPDAERVMKVPDGVVYPSRLVAANAASAAENGAEVLTHAPVTDVRVEDGRATGATLGGDVDETVDADYVVNAAGTWAGECAELAGVEVAMRPTKGVMVSVDYPGLGPVLNRCRPPADGDIVVPHETQAVLGTTSIEVDDPDEFDEEHWEIRKMVEECSKMLPEAAKSEILRTWWGVRPLYAPDEAERETMDGGEGDARGISRGFFLLDHEREGVENFASIVGGKLTTYRMMAEATADHVCEAIGVDEPCRTAEEELPGIDDERRLDEFVAEYDARSPSDEDVLTAD